MVQFLFEEDGNPFSVPPAPWSPTVLGSKLIAWWDARDHGTARMTDDGSGLISMWQDKVAGIQLTGTTTQRPTWTSNALGTGNAGLTFATSNRLRVAATTGLPTGSTAGELWGVGYSTSVATSGTEQLCTYGGSTAATQRQILVNMTAGGARPRVSDASTNLTGSALLANATSIWRGTFSGTTMQGIWNGTALTGSPATIASLNTGTSALTIGASSAGTANFWNGPIAQVLVTQLLTTEEAQSLEGYFAHLLGFTSQLPSSHPYKTTPP